MTNWDYHRPVVEYNGGRKRYVVEPRHEDGSLDVKRITGEFGRKYPASGNTERQLIDYYFRANPGPDSVGMDVIWAWYRAQGLCVRIKTW